MKPNKRQEHLFELNDILYNLNIRPISAYYY